MKFITPLIVAAGIASAMPFEKRDTCTYSYNPNLYWISSHQPTDVATATNELNVNQEIGLVDTVVTFNNIPSGSYGCTLEYNYSPTTGAQVQGTGNPQQINVYALPGTLPSQITWDNIYPLKGSLVGTWNFPTGSALQTPEKIFINSFACASTMNYLFEVADTWSVYGGVFDFDTANSGISMAFNC